jgi:CRISPR-associated protein Cmr1
MQPLAATFRAITPVFCAGYDQNGPSSIRAFSLRGAIRYWYRAVDPQFKKKEGRAFGSSAGEQGVASPFVLIVTTPCTGDHDFRRVFKAGKNESGGAAYLGYSLYMGSHNRKGIAPGTEFSIEVAPRMAALAGSREKEGAAQKKRSELEKARKCWAAGLWLLGHLGGLGSRSRRGIGTIALERWSGWPECEQLPLAHAAETPKEWKNLFRQGLDTIRGWFPGKWESNHGHQVIKDTEKSLTIVQGGCRSWQEAMDTAGEIYKDFRRREPLNRRASLGLPIILRKDRKRRSSKGEMRGYNKGRAASRIHMRIVETNEGYHPLFVALHGPPANRRTLRNNYLRGLETRDPELHMKLIEEVKQNKGGL